MQIPQQTMMLSLRYYTGDFGDYLLFTFLLFDHFYFCFCRVLQPLFFFWQYILSRGHVSGGILKVVYVKWRSW